MLEVLKKQAVGTMHASYRSENLKMKSQHFSSSLSVPQGATSCTNALCLEV